LQNKKEKFDISEKNLKGDIGPCSYNLFLPRRESPEIIGQKKRGHIALLKNPKEIKDF